MAGHSYIANGFWQCITAYLIQLNLIIHVSNKINWLTEEIFFSHWFISNLQIQLSRKEEIGGGDGQKDNSNPVSSWNLTLTMKKVLIMGTIDTSSKKQSKNFPVEYTPFIEIWSHISHVQFLYTHTHTHTHTHTRTHACTHCWGDTNTSHFLKRINPLSCFHAFAHFILCSGYPSLNWQTSILHKKAKLVPCQ